MAEKLTKPIEGDPVVQPKKKEVTTANDLLGALGLILDAQETTNQLLGTLNEEAKKTNTTLSIIAAKPVTQTNVNNQSPQQIIPLPEVTPMGEKFPVAPIGDNTGEMPLGPAPSRTTDPIPPTPTITNTVNVAPATAKAIPIEQAKRVLQEKLRQSKEQQANMSVAPPPEGASHMSSIAQAASKAKRIGSLDACEDPQWTGETQSSNVQMG